MQRPEPRRDTARWWPWRTNDRWPSAPTRRLVLWAAAAAALLGLASGQAGRLPEAQQVHAQPQPDHRVSVKISTSIVESAGPPIGQRPATDQPEPSRQQRSLQATGSDSPLATPNRPPPSYESMSPPTKTLLLTANGRILDHQASMEPGANYRHSISVSRNFSPVKTSIHATPYITQQRQEPQQQQQQQQQLQLQQRQPQRQAVAEGQTPAASGSARSAFGWLGGWRWHSSSRRNSDDLRCHKRSLARMIRSAKSLLTDGFSLRLEQFTQPGNLMLGSGLAAAAVPLLALVLPGGERQHQRRRTDEAQAPAANDTAAGHRPPADPAPNNKLGLLRRVDQAMGWIERSVEHLPNFPRLHPTECVKRSICEAHNEPEKYGAIGFILRLFFPAPSSKNSSELMEYKVINKYRHAAGFGSSRRIDTNGTSSGACKDKYEDCLISLLDVAQNLVDMFIS